MRSAGYLGNLHVYGRVLWTILPSSLAKTVQIRKYVVGSSNEYSCRHCGPLQRKHRVLAGASLAHLQHVAGSPGTTRLLKLRMQSITVMPVACRETGIRA
jgi:hypothetical protein